MSSQFNIKGSILTMLFTALENNPSMSVGEVLYSVTNKKSLKGKRLIEASDNEIYTAVEAFVKFNDEADEPYDDNAFIFWVDKNCN
jgi:hypothetical protein